MGRLPLAFHRAALGFAGEPLKLRPKRWPRRHADGTLDSGLLNHADKPGDGVPAIALLRAEPAGRDDDLAVLREPRTRDALQARAHRRRQAWRAAHIEAQLRGGRYLIHILPARAACTDVAHRDLGLIE